MYTKQSWKYINMVSSESLYYYLSIEYKIYTLCGYQILSDVKNLPLPLPEMKKKDIFSLKV
jgi:hypothetical protein